MNSKRVNLSKKKPGLRHSESVRVDYDLLLKKKLCLDTSVEFIYD